MVSTVSKSVSLTSFATGDRYTGKATLLSRQEVARRLGRSAPHVSNQVRAGRLAPIAHSAKGAWFFRLSDVNAYLRNCGK